MLDSTSNVLKTLSVCFLLSFNISTGQRLKTTIKLLEEAELKNLIEQAESEIKELLDSGMTSYEIGKRSGISNQVIDRYRKGTNAIENMTFKTAKKLIELKKIK